MNIGGPLPRHARFRADHLAVVFEDHRLSYRTLNARVNRLANALIGAGIGKNDKIATLLPNCLELLELYWAIAKIGAVVVPLSPLLREHGLLTLLNDSDSCMVFTTAALAPVLDSIRADLPRIPAENYFVVGENLVPGFCSYAEFVEASSPSEPPFTEINSDDPYNIIYSSGTTGLPKGIVHTHLIRSMYAVLFSAAYRITPESVILHSGSLVFNGAFLTLMPSMFQGATYILHRQFDPAQVIDTIAAERVTHLLMVPSQILALMHAPNFDPERLNSLEMICSLGAPLHREHKDELARRLPGVFYELYGLTEGFVTILDKHDFPAKPDSVGCPPPYYEMRIVGEDGRDLLPGEVGEIVGRGPILMPGYYKRPDLTAQAIRDGWLFTGDMGYVDEDGFLYLVDRKKDLILSGGVNVYPRDIEEILVQHPAVREAAVFGIPDPKWGESPLAAVILREGASVTPEALKAWINARVDARYQQVAAVVIHEDFPRSVAGKTLKRVMREAYWTEQAKI